MQPGCKTLRAGFPLQGKWGDGFIYLPQYLLPERERETVTQRGIRCLNEVTLGVCACMHRSACLFLCSEDKWVCACVFGMTCGSLVNPSGVLWSWEDAQDLLSIALREVESGFWINENQSQAESMQTNIEKEGKENNKRQKCSDEKYSVVLYSFWFVGQSCIGLVSSVQQTQQPLYLLPPFCTDS